MKKKTIWANQFLKIDNARITTRCEKMFIGKREIKGKWNGIFFDAWFGKEGNDDLDLSQMQITGELKERIRRLK